MTLISRLEAATGPDRALDILIAQACPVPGWRVCDDGLVEGYGELDPDHGPDWYPSGAEVPAYTGSLDAALTLVPEGYAVALHHWPKHPATAEIQETALDTWVDGTMQYVGQNIRHNGSAATPAIALAAAALKARGIGSGE